MPFSGEPAKRPIWLWMSGVIFAACLLLGACSANLPKHEKVEGVSEHLGWKLVWSDEFNDAELDRTKWVPERACWGGGNHERQCYTDRIENINVSDGLLKLIARPEKFSGYEFAQDRSNRGKRVTRNFTSGKIRAKAPLSWKYGRFEARIKLPEGQSTWPAFWMLPQDNSYGGWPLSGEIDIMEAVNLGAICGDCDRSKIENRSSVAVHFGKRWPDQKHIAHKRLLPNGKNAYHVFALEWAEGQMDWYVDDQKILTVTQDEWFTDTVDQNANPLAPFDKSFYLILNLAVGGDLTMRGNERGFNPNSFPAELLVDWVRVYQCASDIETGQKCIDLD